MIKKKADDKRQWFLYSANLRTKTLVIIAISILVIVSIFVSGYFIRDIPSSFVNANQMPSLEHLFGTDWMGRDMFLRTIAGLGLSIMVGFIASAVSTCISIILGLFSSFNKVADEFDELRLLLEGDETPYDTEQNAIKKAFKDLAYIYDDLFW